MSWFDGDLTYRQMLSIKVPKPKEVTKPDVKALNPLAECGGGGMREKEAKPKYVFLWCKDCAGLYNCFYQSGEYTRHPMFLEPECLKGPMSKEAKP